MSRLRRAVASSSLHSHPYISSPLSSLVSFSSSSPSKVATATATAAVAGGAVVKNRGVLLSEQLISSKLICFSSSSSFHYYPSASSDPFLLLTIPATAPPSDIKTGKFTMDGRISCDCCDRSYFPTTFTTHHAGNKTEKPLDALRVVLSSPSLEFPASVRTPSLISPDSEYFSASINNHQHHCSSQQQQQLFESSKSLREVLQLTPSWTSLRVFQHFSQDGNDFSNRRLFDDECVEPEFPPRLLEDDQPFIAIKEESGSTLYQRLGDFLEHEEIQNHFSDVDSDHCDYLAPYEAAFASAPTSYSSSSSSSSLSDCGNANYQGAFPTFPTPSFLFTPPLTSSSPISSPQHSDTSSSSHGQSSEHHSVVPPTSTFASLPPAYFSANQAFPMKAKTSAFSPTPTAPAATKRASPSSPFVLAPVPAARDAHIKRPAKRARVEPSESDEAETEQEGVNSSDSEFKPSSSRHSRSKPRSRKTSEQPDEVPAAAEAGDAPAAADDGEVDEAHKKSKTSSNKRSKPGRTGGSKGDRSSPSGANFRLEIGLHQVSILVLRHQGNNGSHPKNKGHYYFQARIRNVYPQRHLWAGWETAEGMEARVRDMLDKQ